MVGDKVVCISNIIYGDVYDSWDKYVIDELTIGNTYTIEKELSNEYYITIINDDIIIGHYYKKSLFITMSELRDNKLNILLNGE